MEALTVVFSWLFTGLVYSLVPILVSALRRKPITQRKHLLFVLGESAIVFVIFALVYAFLKSDNTPKISALIIWANFSYYVGLAILKRNKMLIGSEEASFLKKETLNETAFPSGVRYCHKCGSKVLVRSRFCSNCGERFEE